MNYFLIDNRHLPSLTFEFDIFKPQ